MGSALLSSSLKTASDADPLIAEIDSSSKEQTGQTIFP
jgi:hypothetical protein